MTFNPDNIETAEFFIQKENEDLYKISMDNSVRELLQAMLDNTYSELGNNINQYSPSEKYNSKDKLQIDLGSDYCQNILNLYNNNDIRVDNTQLLEDPDKISYYFFRLKDNQNKKLLAIKKASYFKAVTTHRDAWIRLFNDSLTVFSDNLFKLDNSFDLLIVNNTVFINKYLVFEEIADLGETVKAASIGNISVVEQKAPLISFTEEVKDYIKNHIMAARLVASIKSDHRLENLELNAIQRECHQQGILITVTDGKISFDAADTMNFLKLIDRRLYTINLTGENERFEAKSRQERN